MKTPIHNLFIAAIALSIAPMTQARLIDTHFPILTSVDENTVSMFIETQNGYYMPGPISAFSIEYLPAADGSYIMNFCHQVSYNVTTTLNSIPVDDITAIKFYKPYTGTITMIDCDNEDWDGIYATPRGYFAIRYSDSSPDKPGYDEIRYLSFNGYAVSMMFDSDTGIPLSLTTDDIRLLFCASPHMDSDVDNDGNMIERECEYACDIDLMIDAMTETPSEISLYRQPHAIIRPKAKLPDDLYIPSWGYPDLSKDNPLATSLYAVAECIFINHSDYPILSELYSAFYDVALMDSYQGCGGKPEIETSGIGMAMGTPGGGTKTISDIVALTQGYKNVTDRKATLTGSIRCHSSRFQTEGTYGILVDTDESRLIKGQARYDLPGNQGKLKLSFDVEASGLDPNTDYYYRAYYKLNSASSDLSIKFDNKDPDKISDKTPTETYGKIKKFTTLPPDISGVWHFVNHVFADNLYFDLKFDPHSGKYKANDFYGVFTLEVEVHRNRRVTLSFTSHASGAGFSGYFNEDFSSAKGTGTSSYKSEATPFTMTR